MQNKNILYIVIAFIVGLAMGYIAKGAILSNPDDQLGATIFSDKKVGPSAPVNGAKTTPGNSGGKIGIPAAS
jgi:hypothetical protein